MRRESVRIAGKACVAPIDLQALRAVVFSRDEHAQSDAVGDLRTQLAFLGVHRSHQGEARGVIDRVLTALDVHDALRRRIEQRVDDNVGEQIDLVDVKDVAVRGGEQPGPEGDAAAFERGA